jgi:hypothetical protein
VTEYRRKRKRTGRPYAGKRPYTPNRGGGGYGGPRNYFRTHDFRYEKERDAKLPKTETRYEVIERPSTETYLQPTFYHPEPDQALMDKTVGRAMEKYLRNDSEQTQESPTETHLDSETQSNLPGIGLEANRFVETGPVTIEEKAPEIDLTEPAEPLMEVSQGGMIDKGPELFDIPVADLELLLVELDAIPLEVRPERNIEAEPGGNSNGR